MSHAPPDPPEMSDGEYIRRLEGEVERLRAIVAKLPKTKDGVPVVPGMDVWVPGHGVWDVKPWKIKVTAIDSDGYVSTNIGGRPEHWHVDKCADSREAAEAAIKQKKTAP